MKATLKKLVPKLIKGEISRFKKDKYYKPLLDNLKDENNKERIILIGTPEHGNLGDHLIAEGEIEFLQDRFSDYKIIEITGEHYRYQRNQIQNLVKSEDVIVITGGGFLGSLWMIEEEMVRDIIECFDDNKIVIFPSTIYFENNDFGRRELEKSKKIYRKHKDLSICVRDEKSINMAKQLLGEENSNKIIYTPDIALYLNKTQESPNREGILFCLREDKEKVLSDIDTEEIKRSAKDKGISIKRTSTVIPRQVKKESRDMELQAILGEFRESRLVITDRLHGMVLAAITGTPCIAMDNSSGKVKGVYAWIKYLNYITFANDVDEVTKHIDEYVNLKDQYYTNKEINPAFEKLEEVFRNEE